MPDPAPTASLIVLTYNNLELTRQCLESVFQCTQAPDYEVIVVDNGSQDGTPQALQELMASRSNLRVIFNPHNAGFACGNNQGAAQARGEYLVFLNNDTVVTRGWLSGLLRHLDDPQVGMVGPVTNSAGNESRIEVDYQSLEDMPAFAERYTRAHQGTSFEIRMLAFFCAAMRRAVFEEIGPLDERFGIGMFEDDDYALRLKEKGYRLLCAEDVYVHHAGSASFASLTRIDYLKLFQENRRKFEEKWGVEWRPHQYRAELFPRQQRELIDGILWLTAQVETQNQSIQALGRTIAEKDASIARLGGELAEKEQAVTRLGVELDYASKQLSEMQASPSWKLLMALGRARLKLIPAGSAGDRLLRRLARAIIK